MARQVGPVPEKADNTHGSEAVGSIGIRYADFHEGPEAYPPTRPDIRLQPILKRPIEDVLLANREESIYDGLGIDFTGQWESLRIANRLNGQIHI
jgi:hypothetical protein